VTVAEPVPAPQEAAEPFSENRDVIRTPDQRVRVFVSSTLSELADERRAVRSAIERQHLTAVMFELGARPHPPSSLYRAYLRQSHVFVGIYHESYGWVAAEEQVSGLEDEFRLSLGMPRLLYVKRPAPDIEPRLQELLDAVERDGAASYRVFTDAEELAGLVQDDLATLMSERFMTTGAVLGRGHPSAEATRPPVPLTRTIGRDADIDRVAGLLTTGTRLLTLTGPGGIGKSRLALEVARVVADHYADGVGFVPLENVTDTRQVLRAIAVGVKVADEGTRPIVDVLADALAKRHMLLLIDNMEQVVAAGPALSALLGRCPGISALVTSRQVLRLRGEREYHLGPLTVPYGPDDDSIRSVPAVRLFVQRAVAANPDFQLTRANRAPIAELTRVLDGLPLAIELAAARTRLMSPASLLERLTEQLDVLADGGSDLPARQRTLGATLDWSYHLLNPPERALFARMAVFVGGATLEAIEGVCRDETVPNVLGVVSSLVEKSLLATSATDTADAPRIVMLQIVRPRALELLAERGEAEAFTARYVEWYADFCEQADVLTHAGAPRRWPALEQEGSNLRAVVQWATAHADGALLASLARGLWPWLWISGRVGELREAVARALAALPADAAPHDRGYLHYVAAYAQGLTGDLAAALDSANRALQEYEADDGDEKTLLVAAARLVRGTVSLGLGKVDGVDADLDHAVAVARALDNSWLLGYATSHRGLRRAMQGDLEGARDDHETSLDVATSNCNEVLAAQAIGQLAIIDVLQQRLEDAHDRLRSQVDHLKRAQHLEGLANALDTTAALAVAHQQWDPAARAAAAAQHLRDRLRMAPWPLIREYHDDCRHAARKNLGDRAPAIEAEGVETDPWTVIDDALIGLHGLEKMTA
jgi:predicted ATPase